LFKLNFKKIRQKTAVKIEAPKQRKNLNFFSFNLDEEAASFYRQMAQVTAWAVPQHSA
jgi:hypothetical protein